MRKWKVIRIDKEEGCHPISRMHLSGCRNRVWYEKYAYGRKRTGACSFRGPIYYERLDKVKDILSDSMYETLSPEMSKEEIQAEKEQAAKVDKDSITKTKITDTRYSYRWKKEGSYEVSVIYTQRVTRGDFSDQERYLCRMEVTKKDKRYIITNIYEDSALSDGLY